MNSEKQYLKMSLQEIRDSINLNKTRWINNGDTNCYAFALGLDIIEEKIIDHAYIPGVMSDSSIKLYNDDIIDNIFKYDDFIKNLYMDLDFLGISFREIKPREKIFENEWKIAIYTTPCTGGCEDFHFLRLCNDGIWHHKSGYSYSPTKYDDRFQIITNIEDCFLDCRKFEKCLSLKLR